MIDVEIKIWEQIAYQTIPATIADLLRQGMDVSLGCDIQYRMIRRIQGFLVLPDEKKESAETGAKSDE